MKTKITRALTSTSANSGPTIANASVKTRLAASNARARRDKKSASMALPARMLMNVWKCPAHAATHTDAKIQMAASNAFVTAGER